MMGHMRFLQAASLCLLLSACDGDSRPFSEAVEVRAANLTSIEIAPPINSLPEIILNPGQRLQMGITGVSASGQRITLESSDRDWRVSDPSVAVIDGSGQLRALADGPVSVFLELGGLVAQAFPVEVDNQTLVSISVISGEASVERCRPEDYFATGIFTDGRPRLLDDVTWSLPAVANADGRVFNNPDGTATLTALNVSMLSLTATSAAVTQSLAVEVSDTLRSLVITPNPASVNVGEELDLVATGQYASSAPVEGQPDPSVNQVVITEQVTWDVVSGESAASISNADGSRGQVSGVAAGTATVNASCGNLFAEPRTITVSASSDSDDSDALTFNVASPFTLPRTQSNGFRLRVSTGTIYDEDNDVSEDVTWTFTSLETTTNPITLVQSGEDAGLIRPLAEGSATVTATTSDGVTNTITVRVSNS